MVCETTKRNGRWSMIAETGATCVNDGVIACTRVQAAKSAALRRDGGQYRPVGGVGAGRRNGARPVTRREAYA